LKLKEENDRKQRELAKKRKSKKEESAGSHMFNQYMKNNWSVNKEQHHPPKHHENPRPVYREPQKLPKYKPKQSSMSPGLIDRLSKNINRDRSPIKDNSLRSKALMMKKSPKKYDTIQFNVLPLKDYAFEKDEEKVSSMLFGSIGFTSHS